MLCMHILIQLNKLIVNCNEGEIHMKHMLKPLYDKRVSTQTKNKRYENKEKGECVEREWIADHNLPA